MTVSSFVSKGHLDQCDLNADFIALIDTFMSKVDNIGFRPDSKSLLYEIYNDERLLPALQSLLDHLRFKTSDTCNLCIWETRSNNLTEILEHSTRHKSRSGRDKEPYWYSLHHYSLNYECTTNLRIIVTSWTQFIPSRPIFYGAITSKLSSFCTS